jgi:hypothetical protein
MARSAVFSACIFGPFIEPEQSPMMMKCSGRLATPPPGINESLTTSGLSFRAGQHQPLTDALVTADAAGLLAAAISAATACASPCASHGTLVT